MSLQNLDSKNGILSPSMGLFIPEVTLQGCTYQGRKKEED